MFLDDKGEADSDKSLYTGAASGVPGTVAGMRMALDTYGSMPWADVIAPAIRLAEEGIIVTPDLADSLEAEREALRTRWKTMSAEERQRWLGTNRPRD